MTWMVATARAQPQLRGSAVCLAVILALAAGCGEGPPPQPAHEASPGDEPPPLTETRFAAELDVDLDDMTTVSPGVFIRDRRQGRGATAEAGRRVVIQYRGWLPDGTLFEERPSPEGFGASEFVLGENAPVYGLNAALAGMRTGGSRLVVLGPEHGYGLVGRPAGVPAGSPLIFEVTLLRVAD